MVIIGFILRRLAASVVVIYLITTIVFFLAHASPYSPIYTILGVHSTQQNVTRLRALYGLNLPIWKQYLNYMGGLLHGNLGYSYSPGYLGVPVWSIIRNYAPATLILGGYALVLSLLVGLPIGLISALKQNSFVDHGSQSVMVLLYVMPAFVLVPVCQLIFGVDLKLLPVLGWGGSNWTLFGLIPNPGDTLKEMILPVSLYAAGLAGFWAKSFRSFMLEILRQDYVRTARAKGLKSRVVIYLHVVKNTLIPLASIVGPAIALLITGAFIIERFFSIPGIGYLTVQSVLDSDYPVIVGTTLILVTFVIVVNMLTDIFNAVVDPRVRLA